MALHYETCNACGGSGITPGKEHLPESFTAGNNDCYLCFGMGSVLPIYNTYPAVTEKQRPTRKRVKVTSPAPELTYHCHTGCITALGEICLCRCEGANHGVAS